MTLTSYPTSLLYIQGSNVTQKIVGADPRKFISLLDQQITNFEQVGNAEVAILVP